METGRGMQIAKRGAMRPPGGAKEIWSIPEIFVEALDRGEGEGRRRRRALEESRIHTCIVTSDIMHQAHDPHDAMLPRDMYHCHGKIPLSTPSGRWKPSTESTCSAPLYAHVSISRG